MALHEDNDPGRSADLGIRMLLADKHPDITITCRGYSFPVHRAVLCLKSEYFRAAFNAGFRESEEKTVDLSSDSQLVIARLILFFYTESYPDNNGHEEVFRKRLQLHHKWLDRIGKTAASSCSPSWRDPTDFHSVGLHIQMYVAGDKYLSEELKRYAEQCLMGAFKKVNIHLGEQYRKALYAAATVVYSQIPNTSQNRYIRDLLVYRTQNDSSTLLQPSQMLSQLIIEVPDFAADLLTRGKRRKTIFCTNCNCHIKIGDLSCKCGLSGACMLDQNCAGAARSQYPGSLEDVRCWRCHRTGTLTWAKNQG